jgi:hypothetical protein
MEPTDMPTSSTLLATFVSAVVLVPVIYAQQAPPPAAAPSPASKAPASITMTGCISAEPETSGRYTFSEADGLREYRLNGKGIRKFAGKRVELVGGTSGNGLAIRGGLWPSGAGGARGVALDPAQEAIARQPGGGGAGIGAAFPEFRVSRVRPVPGVCE